MHQITLREAVEDDCGAILDLITELAIYEQEPDAVECEIDDLKRDGFGPNPLFHCLIAELDGKVVGFSLYFFKWSTWRGRATLHLEDLFVLPDARGHGVGFKLLQKLAQIALEKQCRRFEWEVLDWNHLARDFYHNLGAFYREGWLPYRIEGDALKKLAGV